MSVKFVESKQAATRHTMQRRGPRMNSRVPVRIEWNTAAGERTHGAGPHPNLNPSWCMIVLKQSLELEDRVALTNIANHSTNAAVVVWKGGPRPDGWEYGIELVAPEMDFWGLEL